MKSTLSWFDPDTCQCCIHYGNEWCWRKDDGALATDTVCDNVRRKKHPPGPDEEKLKAAQQLLEQAGFVVSRD